MAWELSRFEYDRACVASFEMRYYEEGTIEKSRTGGNNVARRLGRVGAVADPGLD
jgi:hypothetical protein